MIVRAWSWILSTLTTAYVKRRCRSLVRHAGFSRVASSDDWVCSQCDERLDDVQLEKIVHTFAGETFKHPTMVATMCPRCAWVADGDCKIPIWKWLYLKDKGSSQREFFLKTERAGLRMRLAEIEQELHPRPTLLLENKNLESSMRRLKKSKPI